MGALAASFGILGAGWCPLFRAYVVASFFNLVLPGAVLGDVHRVWDARDTAGGAPAALGIARCILFRLLSQVTLVAAVFVHSLTLDSAVAWYWFFVVPFITLVSLIPVSIGGAGVREYLYMTLFGTALAALGLSPAVFAVSIAWGLAGLGLFLRDRRAGAKTAG